MIRYSEGRGLHRRRGLPHPRRGAGGAAQDPRSSSLTPAARAVLTTAPDARPLPARSADANACSRRDLAAIDMRYEGTYKAAAVRSYVRPSAPAWSARPAQLQRQRLTSPGVAGTVPLNGITVPLNGTPPRVRAWPGSEEAMAGRERRAARAAGQAKSAAGQARKAAAQAKKAAAEAQFAATLAGLEVLLRTTARRYPAFAARLREHDLVAQIRLAGTRSGPRLHHQGRQGAVAHGACTRPRTSPCPSTPRRSRRASCGRAATTSSSSTRSRTSRCASRAPTSSRCGSPRPCR